MNAQLWYIYKDGDQAYPWQGIYDLTNEQQEWYFNEQAQDVPSRYPDCVWFVKYQLWTTSLEGVA